MGILKTVSSQCSQELKNTWICLHLHYPTPFYTGHLSILFLVTGYGPQLDNGKSVANVWNLPPSESNRQREERANGENKKYFWCCSVSIIRQQRREQSTAAIDGTSARPGDPWETSIPMMIVGTFETIGIEGECSTVKREFMPPIYQKNKDQNRQ